MTADPQHQPPASPNTAGAWYPKYDLVGIVGDGAAAAQTVEALERAGVAAAEIRTWTLPEVEAGFQAYQAHRARLEHLGADLSAGEIDAAEAYYAALKAGQCVLSVHTPQPEQVEQAAQVLKAQGARTLRYYGPWTVAGLDTITST